MPLGKDHSALSTKLSREHHHSAVNRKRQILQKCEKTLSRTRKKKKNDRLDLTAENMKDITENEKLFHRREPVSKRKKSSRLLFADG